MAAESLGVIGSGQLGSEPLGLAVGVMILDARVLTTGGGANSSADGSPTDGRT